jgi:UDP-N-acetylmuramyl pentapeptide phosphotransferase/UDP-N-acetylglucosamine-1-phosphate transferase
VVPPGNSRSLVFSACLGGLQRRADGIIHNLLKSQLDSDDIVQPAAWAPLTAFAATLLTIWWLLRSRLARIALDHPNERSLHHAPVPRTGGIGIFIGVFIAWATIAPELPAAFLPALVLVLATSIIDDIYGVPVAVRFFAHLVAAGMLAGALLYDHGGVVVTIIAMLAIGWMANLYNFMDGSDGLAGGMAAFGFGAYGAAAWIAGHPVFALVNLSVAAAAAAFLVFNFHPARIFMGDVGSVPLGFLASALGLLGWQQAVWTWWFPLLVFSPFIVDASVTLARRLLRMERVWQAHRDHYYQRLVQLGWGHRKTALAEYVLMVACGTLGIALLGRSTEFQVTALITAALAYLALIAAIEIAWRRFRTVA